MSSIAGVSSSSQLAYAKQLFSKMDADGSGGVSQEEFVNARPSDVSESMATDLFNSLDSSGTGSLSESDIETMESNKKGKTGTGTASLDDSTLQAILQSLGSSSLTSSSTTTSASDTSSSGDSLADMISAMDTDGDGTVTKGEFLAARPDDVSETMAENLWSQFDTEDAGELSTGDLQTAMAQNAPPPPPPSGMGGMASSSSEDDDDTSSIVSAMDTNGDGIVSQAEFLAARPEGMTEDQATSFWNELDTEGAGELSTSDLQTAMAQNAPPPPPDGMGVADSTSSDSVQNWLEQLTSSSSSSTTSSSSSTTGTTLSANIQALLEAIKSYQSTAGYDSSSQLFASVMATA